MSKISGARACVGVEMACDANLAISYTYTDKQEEKSF